jgi:hypothetical protein
MSNESDPESTQKGGMVAASIVAVSALIVLACIVGAMILSVKP